MRFWHRYVLTCFVEHERLIKFHREVSSWRKRKPLIQSFGGRQPAVVVASHVIRVYGRVLRNWDSGKTVGSLTGGNVGHVTIARRYRACAGLLPHFVQVKNYEADIKIWRSGRRSSRCNVGMAFDRDDLRLAKRMQLEAFDVPEDMRGGDEDRCLLQLK